MDRWLYLSGSSTREDGLHHDTCAPASYDAKTEAFAVIDELDHLHVTFLLQMRCRGRGRRRQKRRRERSCITWKKH